MFNPARLARIRSVMHKCSKRRATSCLDPRPASEMIGQNCLGYIPAANGQLLRVAVEVTGPESVGPGSYDPVLLTSSRASTIPRSERKTELAQARYRVGPGDYMARPPHTHLTHLLRLTDPPRPQSPPKSGELAHPSWLPKDSVAPPFKPVRCAPPAFRSAEKFLQKIAKQQKMAQQPNLGQEDADGWDLYSDGDDGWYDQGKFEGRPLWNMPKWKTPDPTAHALQPEPPVYDPIDATSQFLSRFSRFADPKPQSPACTAYSIPAPFGDAPSTIIHAPYVAQVPEKAIRDNDLNLPDPTSYAPESVVQLPDYYECVAIPRGPRFPSDETPQPGPGAYSVKRSLNGKQTRLMTTAGTKKDQWDYLSAAETPDPNKYQGPIISIPKKGGYISSLGHDVYQSQPDHPLAFTTQHSSLIKRSYNAHYLEPLPKKFPKNPKTSHKLSNENNQNGKNPNEQSQCSVTPYSQAVAQGSRQNSLRSSQLNQICETNE